MAPLERGRWRPLVLLGLALAAGAVGHSGSWAEENKTVHELLEPAGPAFWEQLTIEQQLAELDRHERETLVRHAYFFVDLTPLAELAPGETVWVSVTAFPDFRVESELMRRERRPGSSLSLWGPPRPTTSLVVVQTDQVGGSHFRGLEDPERLLSVFVRHKGKSLLSHGVDGAPNVICLEDRLNNMSEPPLGPT